MSEEFSTTLQSLLSLKPPGVSGSRIRKLCQLAVDSVQSESVLIQNLYTHCKKTPSSHKLGAFYVVDAVARAYQDQAKKHGEKISADASDGTYGAALYRMSQLIESVVDDIFSSTPASSSSDELADKVRKVVDIWDKAGTFPADTVARIRTKYLSTTQGDSQNRDAGSTTPPGAPPSVSSILGSGVGAHSASGASQPPVPAPATAPSVPADTASILQALASFGSASTAPTATSVSGQSWNLGSARDAPSSNGHQQPGGGYDPRQRQHQPSNVRQPQHDPRDPRGGGGSGHYNSGDSGMPMHRSRSRSPPPRDYREQRIRARSPPRLSREEYEGPPPSNLPAHKWSIDNSLPSGSIRVFSRTLFIGGLNPEMNILAIRDAVSDGGEVQSIIFHRDKRHAFVKVYTRDGAERAKKLMEERFQRNQTQMRARWGVGFGPRDCSDYHTGVSIVPISRLTDADKRWIVQAPFGGTGGQPLVTGLVIEEPDIEIGAGVSSKAMSRRMPSQPQERPHNTYQQGPVGYQQQQHQNQHQDQHQHQSQNQNQHGNNNGGFHSPRDGPGGYGGPPPASNPPVSADIQAFLASIQK